MVNYTRKGNKSLKNYGLYNPVKSGELKNMGENKNMPDYTVSVPIEHGEGKDKKTFWQNIGSAWKKEKGISIQLNALPLQSNIFLFEADKKDKE